MDNNIYNLLMATVLMGGFMGGFITVIRTFTDYVLKRNMINKGMVNAEAQILFKKQEVQSVNKYSPLKWGLILFFAGASLIAMEYLGVNGESPLPYGLFTVAVALGFLVYYFIARKELDKSK
jgi:uncharacterized protein YneF (UPF0154 family)